MVIHESAIAEREMLRARSGIVVPFLSADELRYAIFQREAINIRTETALRHLRDIDLWPSGYREVVEEFALRPETAKLHTFSYRDWAVAVEALYSQTKRRGEPISNELARKVSVQKVLRDLVKDDEHPSMTAVYQIEEAIKSDPLLEQSFASSLESPVSATQRKRIAPHFKKYVVQKLSDVTNLNYKTASDIGILIRKYDLKGDDINRLFAEAVQTYYPAADALMREALRPKGNGQPSDVLLSNEFQRALAKNKVGGTRVFHAWQDMMQMGGEQLVRHISSLPGWATNKDLHQFVAKLAVNTDLATFKESVRVLDGKGQKLYDALYDPENVDWLFDHRPDIVDDLFPNFKFLRAKASWQVDPDWFQRVLTSLSMDSRDVLVLTRHMEALSRNGTLQPDILKSWQSFIESKLKGDSGSPASRRALVESARKLRIWSPEIENSLVAWVTKDRLNIVTSSTDSPILAVRSALQALGEAQQRGQLTEASEELMVSGIKSPVEPPSRMSAYGQKLKFSDLFYSSQLKKWNMVEPWLDLVQEMKNSSAKEQELRKILEAFYYTQNPLPKRAGLDLSSPFLFDESTIRRVFSIIEEGPVLSESFRVYLKERMADPKMRRALYEYAPGIVSKYNLPVTAAMRLEIERLKSGREYSATNQLVFNQQREMTTLDGFLKQVLQSMGPGGDVLELPKSPRAKEQVGVTKTGQNAEVRLLPVTTKHHAGPQTMSTKKFADLEKLSDIERWTNTVLGETEFDRRLFSDELTESEIAFARIEKFMSDSRKERGPVLERLLKDEWSLTADARDSLTNRFSTFASELRPEEKARIVNQILNGEIPEGPLSKSLITPLIDQSALGLPANWRAASGSSLKSPADFRIASAMLQAGTEFNDSHFFDLLTQSDLKLGKAEFIRVRDVLQSGKVNAMNLEDQARLRKKLAVEISGVLRRSDFLQGGPDRARLAISLLDMIDIDSPEVQSALVSRKGAITGMFYQTRRSEVPAVNQKGGVRGLLHSLVYACADAYHGMKRK